MTDYFINGCEAQKFSAKTRVGRLTIQAGDLDFNGGVIASLVRAGNPVWIQYRAVDRGGEPRRISELARIPADELRPWLRKLVRDVERAHCRSLSIRLLQQVWDRVR